MYEWRISREMRPASTSGSAEPAAKGTTVKGTSAMETALLNVSYTIPPYIRLLQIPMSHLSKLQW